MQYKYWLICDTLLGKVVIVLLFLYSVIRTPYSII